MIDIIVRLRYGTAQLSHLALIHLCAEAADEIGRLQMERDQLMEQLAMRQPSAVERDMQEIMRINNELKAEIERMQEEQRVSEIDVKAAVYAVSRCEAEIERLLGALEIKNAE
jgi:hypothetical protein